LSSAVSSYFSINKFLNNYNPLVFKDGSAKEIYIDSNLIKSQNNSIITKNNPAILFQFEKEVELDKSLFSLDYPFTINYVKTTDYTDYNNPKTIEDKKQILLKVD
jgi:hypothetical protein